MTLPISGRRNFPKHERNERCSEETWLKKPRLGSSADIGKSLMKLIGVRTQEQVSVDYLSFEVDSRFAHDSKRFSSKFKSHRRVLRYVAILHFKDAWRANSLNRRRIIYIFLPLSILLCRKRLNADNNIQQYPWCESNTLRRFISSHGHCESHSLHNPIVYID
jgi:hypothetical protein